MGPLTADHWYVFVADFVDRPTEMCVDRTLDVSAPRGRGGGARARRDAHAYDPRQVDQPVGSAAANPSRGWRATGVALAASGGVS